MQVGHELEFNCPQCEKEVTFSVLQKENHSDIITCKHCEKHFAFEEGMKNKLTQFAKLCRQIQESKDILGDAAIAVDLGDRNVKVPFRLLLTRLSSVLELEIGGKSFPIHFRLEPIADLEALDASLAKN